MLTSPTEPRRRRFSFPAWVAAMFTFGWILGLVTLLQTWRLLALPRWIVVSGWGYVMVMLVPIGTGVLVTRIAGALARHGWGAGGVRLALSGLAAAVAGLFLLGC